MQRFFQSTIDAKYAPPVSRSTQVSRRTKSDKADTISLSAQISD
jgi:hypothetical protein